MKSKACNESILMKGKTIWFCLLGGQIYWKKLNLSFGVGQWPVPSSVADLQLMLTTSKLGLLYNIFCTIFFSLLCNRAIIKLKLCTRPLWYLWAFSLFGSLSQSWPSYTNKQYSNYAQSICDTSGLPHYLKAHHTSMFYICVIL